MRSVEQGNSSVVPGIEGARLLDIPIGGYDPQQKVAQSISSILGNCQKAVASIADSPNIIEGQEDVLRAIGLFQSLRMVLQAILDEQTKRKPFPQSLSSLSANIENTPKISYCLIIEDAWRKAVSISGNDSFSTSPLYTIWADLFGQNLNEIKLTTEVSALAKALAAIDGGILYLNALIPRLPTPAPDQQ